MTAVARTARVAMENCILTDLLFVERLEMGIERRKSKVVR
jgi:hypothetical protein